MDLFALIGTPTKRQRFAAGEYLFRQGDRDAKLHWLSAGYMKATYMSAEGREFVKSLLAPGAFVGSLHALDGEGTATFSLRAQTDCEVRTITYGELRALASRDHAIALAVMDFLIGFARRKERREFELLCLTAAERHQEAVRALADFAQVFSQADIAAYIGITPQALSRIKKRGGVEPTDERPDRASGDAIVRQKAAPWAPPSGGSE